jgi:hypothetical protein
MTDETQQATQLPNPTGWKLLCAIPEVEDKFSGTDLLKPDSMAKIEEHSTTVLFVIKVGLMPTKTKVNFRKAPGVKRATLC